MRQYDVLISPVVRLRAIRPYVLVLQHERASFDEDVVIAPLATDTSRPTRLSPVLPVLGVRFQLVTRNLTFMHVSRLTGEPIDNLEAYSHQITRALDQLFTAAG